MVAFFLTLILSFVVGGGLWLALGPRLSLSEDQEVNGVRNLWAYVVMCIPVVFVFVFFAIERL